MQFALSEEQQMLADIARKFVRELPSARATLERDPGAPLFSKEDWSRVLEEQGWPIIAVPEECGGFGFGWMELAVVFEELGRALSPCPLLGTAWATAALLERGTPEQQAHWLGDVAEAESKGALALDTGITAVREGDGWRMSGVAEAVVHGMEADFVILEASGELFLISGVLLDREPLPTLDPLRPMARIRCEGLADEGSRLPRPATGLTRARCLALLAAECAGAAESCLEMTIDYAKVRRQFAAPIGSFQAIQHICADMLVAVESARSAAWYAAWAIDAGADDAILAARTAAATATEALFHCAGQSIQVHGGIGFTWEHDAHLYFKRARAAMSLLGEPRTHRAAVAAALLGAL